MNTLAFSVVLLAGQIASVTAAAIAIQAPGRIPTLNDTTSGVPETLWTPPYGSIVHSASGALSKLQNPEYGPPKIECRPDARTLPEYMQPWGLENIYAHERPIVEGIDYIRETLGDVWRGEDRTVGPNICERVSCSWNSAIEWCNDSPTAKSVDTWSTIADAAQTVLSECFKDNTHMGAGTYHLPNAWRVVIDGDRC